MSTEYFPVTTYTGMNNLIPFQDDDFHFFFKEKQSTPVS